MLKIKKMILLIIPILLLCGCERNTNIGDKKSNYDIFCDKEYGIEYIEYFDMYRYGITVRYDKNGNLIHCED